MVTLAYLTFVLRPSQNSMNERKKKSRIQKFDDFVRRAARLFEYEFAMRIQ